VQVHYYNDIINLDANMLLDWMCRRYCEVPVQALWTRKESFSWTSWEVSSFACFEKLMLPILCNCADDMIHTWWCWNYFPRKYDTGMNKMKILSITGLGKFHSFQCMRFSSPPHLSAVQFSQDGCPLFLELEEEWHCGTKLVLYLQRSWSSSHMRIILWEIAALIVAMLQVSCIICLWW
jgi:hypothetical protein